MPVSAGCRGTDSKSDTCRPLAISSFGEVSHIPITSHLDRSDSSRHDRERNKTSCFISGGVAGGRRPPCPHEGQPVSTSAERQDIAQSRAGGGPTCPRMPPQGLSHALQDQGQQQSLGPARLPTPGPPQAWHRRASLRSSYGLGVRDPPDNHRPLHKHALALPRTPSFQRAWGRGDPISAR